MFICINDYCTKKAAPSGAAPGVGGRVLVVANAATFTRSNGLLRIR